MDLMIVETLDAKMSEPDTPASIGPSNRCYVVSSLAPVKYLRGCDELDCAGTTKLYHSAQRRDRSLGLTSRDPISFAFSTCRALC